MGERDDWAFAGDCYALGGRNVAIEDIQIVVLWDLDLHELAVEQSKLLDSLRGRRLNTLQVIRLLRVAEGILLALLIF